VLKNGIETVYPDLHKYSDQLFSPSVIINILKENGLALKRRMGQNLLINRDAALRILQYGCLQSDDRVLEIGPGLGTMTFLLAEKVKQVVAVEIDSGFVKYLQRMIDEFGVRNVHIVHADFLSLRSDELESPSKVISNFPYSIAIKALIMIAEEMDSVQTVVGTVQRELASRITAVPGEKDYSFVSVYLQFLTQVSIVENVVGAQNFFPQPEVESSVIRVYRDTGHRVGEVGFFRETARQAFSNRRKKLINNLSAPGLDVQRSDLERIVSDLFGNPHIRAEELTVSDFTRLCAELRRFLKTLPGLR
jgi:16S rRNA (adenine1518-N6/adenine1519-N6)-dimethyltransferase